MSNLRGNSISASAPSDIKLRRIAIADVVAALRQGVSDFMEKPSHYVFLVLIYPIMGIVIGVWTSGNDALPLLYPLVTGFALLGPFAALGLYEISRRRAIGLDTSWRHAFEVLRSPQIVPILGVGLILLAIFIAWLLSAEALYGWTHLGEAQTSLATFAANVFGTSAGWTLLVLGNLIGLVFALVVLSISVVAFPLLLDRPVGVGAAIATSLQATMLNPVPVFVWGAIVAALMFAGSLPLFAGLAVVLPVLGHATWHLYRKLVV